MGRSFAATEGSREPVVSILASEGVSSETVASIAATESLRETLVSVAATTGVSREKVVRFFAATKGSRETIVRVYEVLQKVLGVTSEATPRLEDVGNWKHNRREVEGFEGRGEEGISGCMELG